MKLGLVVNPYAGLGGSVALKGSDGVLIRNKALALGARSHVAERVSTALSVLELFENRVSICTYPGVMGADICARMKLDHRIVGALAPKDTSPEDTLAAVRLILEQGVDLLLFAGGDGTARDVCSVLPTNQLVLGIPCGVKMQSGVFAVTPRAVGDILEKILAGDLVGAVSADVRDLDEDAFRNGEIRARFYGEMIVPMAPNRVQQVKSANPESETMAMDDLAAWVAEWMHDDATWIMGSGSTIARIMEQLGIAGTLLGIDVVRSGRLVASDVTEQQLLSLIDEDTRLMVTAIGGQGHIFGRGNQQLSCLVLNKLNRQNIQVVATRGKLADLQKRPLLVDTGDVELDKSLSGFITVICGYDDAIVYEVSC